MRRILALLPLLFVLVAAAPVPAQTNFVDHAKAATAILYSQDSFGGLKMHCTVTAFETIDKGYNFVTAAHCVGEDDADKKKVADTTGQTFYITFDESDPKVFYRAELTSLGYQHRGDDFAVFAVHTARAVAIVPVGDETKEQEGNPVLNIASPLGLGLQVFRGAISKLALDRPVVSGDINWQGAVLLQMPGTNGGSSGSSVLSEKQEKIVAFLVGTIGGTTITAIPVSRFIEFRKRIAAKKYPFSRTED